MRLHRRADPDLGGAALRLEEGRQVQDYCDEIKGMAKANGVEVTELSTHLQGQLVAVHPGL